MFKFLEDVKVVSLTRAAAGSACAKILSENGAETYLVEPVRGHPLRHLNYYEMYHGNMKSVPVNLHDPKGMELLQRLLAKADIFISNYRPGALQQMGLDYRTLGEKYPRLIYATLTGYGEKGPMAAAPGFDITAFWARSGLISDVMERGGDSIVVPSGVGDIECGKTLAMGVIMALYEREKTGKGMKVSSSLYSEGLYANNCPIIDQQCGVEYPKTRKDPGRAMKNSFRCKDGWIQTMTLNWEKDFPNFLRIVGREDLVGDPRWKTMKDTEGKNAIELTKIFDAGFARLTVAEAVKAIQDADMAVSAYFSGKDTVTDEQADANDYFDDIVDLKAGRKLRLPRIPLQFGEKPEYRPMHYSRLGEDSKAVMKQYGYSDAEIEEFIKNGTVVATQA
jgi:crotonobetainyl-CoA:carnitine CoA-transferase CaiB-like acyl-CoA transferase